MHASNPETIYSAGSEDWTGSACTVPMSHRDKPRQDKKRMPKNTLSENNQQTCFAIFFIILRCLFCSFFQALLTPPPDDEELLLDDDPHFLWWWCFTFTCPNGAGNILPGTASHNCHMRPTTSKTLNGYFVTRKRNFIHLTGCKVKKIKQIQNCTVATKTNCIHISSTVAFQYKRR